MSVIEDVRKVVQDLVAPELKSISVKLDGFERESKLRDDNLAARIENADREAKVRGDLTQVKLEALSAKMDAQYTSIMNALDLNRRVETLERDKQSASA